MICHGTIVLFSNVTFISNGFRQEIYVEEKRRKNKELKRKRRENWEPPKWDDMSCRVKIDFQILVRFCTPRNADNELHTNTQYVVGFVFLPICFYRSPKRMRCLSIQTPFLGFFPSNTSSPTIDYLLSI